jgi:hypothetical protein
LYVVDKCMELWMRYKSKEMDMLNGTRYRRQTKGTTGHEAKMLRSDGF